MSLFPRTKRVALTSGLISLIPLQNGAVEETFSSAKPDAATANVLPVVIAPTTAKQRIGSSETSSKLRPGSLNVISNKFVTKNIHAEVDDGSVPCSPETLPDIDGLMCSAADEALEADTRELINISMSDLIGLSKPQWSENQAQTTMKRVVTELLAKHRYAYNGIINRLSVDLQESNMHCVNAVAKSMFSDGKTNWGRIASLVAFGTTVCQYLKEHGQMDCVSVVAHEISSYLLLEQRDWLLQNNSWDGFVEFFRVADPESTVRNALMAVVGVAGIGVSLAMLLR